MKRKKGKKSLFKKIIKLIIVKIKQLAKYILTTAKQTRLRTKIIYVLLALVAFGLFNYRKGELSIPKKVVLFNKVNMNKYNMEIYYMDEDDIEEYTQNYFPSVYRDGIKYYVTGKGHKYRLRICAVASTSVPLAISDGWKVMLPTPITRLAPLMLSPPISTHSRVTNETASRKGVTNLK